MPTVIIRVSGGMVQEVLMDEPMRVYVLDYDQPTAFEEEQYLQIEGEECIDAYYADIVDPERVREIVREIRAQQPEGSLVDDEI